MAGSMQAAGRISVLLALRRILAVLQPLALLLLLNFRCRARQGDAAASTVADTASSTASGKKGKAAVVLRVPAGSPMACARRQALARREAAMRRAREAGREYELTDLGKKRR